MPLTSKSDYNIASRAAQSNSVYVSVLKIPIVHAESVSKSLRQKFFFFARAAIVSAGKDNIFHDNNGYKQRLGPPVLKKLELPSAIASGNSYASFVLSKLPTCSITR